MGLRRGILLAAAFLIALPSVFGEEVLVKYKTGRLLRVSDAAFHMGPRADEEKGVVIGTESLLPPKEIVRYTQVDYKLGSAGAKQLFYVPWSELQTIQMIDSAPRDEYSHPAKLTMRDGKVFEISILMNGAYPFLIGNTQEGGPVEEEHNVIEGKNCSIHLSKIASIEPITAGKRKKSRLFHEGSIKPSRSLSARLLGGLQT